MMIRFLIVVIWSVASSVLFAQDANVKKRGQTAGRPTRQFRMPDYADVPYGRHEKQRFDVWLAKTKDGSPTPLAVFYHAGGFAVGDKSTVRRRPIQRYLNAGVSVAAVNYRLTDAGPYPMPMLDSARALQTIRHNAKKYSVDSKRIGCFGTSAGGGISLWLAFHDDLAEPDSNDPIARQSTRIVAAAVRNGQCSYDLNSFREWFKCPTLKMIDVLYPFYGVKNDDEWQTQRVRGLMVDASAITHLDKNDRIPVFGSYEFADQVSVKTSPQVWVHHIRFGQRLKRAMDGLEIECVIVQGKGRASAGGYRDRHDFLIKKLKNP